MRRWHDLDSQFALGQSVMWLHQDERGKETVISAKVANVIGDRVVIRIVMRPEGAVYFKPVKPSELCAVNPLLQL